MPGPTGHPLVQVASLLVLGVVLVGAVVLGAVLLALLATAAVVAAAAFSLRLWWLRRRLSRGDRDQGPSEGGRVIHAEYTVVAERDMRRPRD